MRAARLLAGLYPPAVRERWGQDLCREVQTTGLRSWPDTLAGAARLWLHPADWPETSTGQTRRVLTVTLFVIASATVLLLRTGSPAVTVTTDIGHPLTSLWLAPLLVGTVLATPLPPLRIAALCRLLGVTVRLLAVPVAQVAILFVLARNGILARATGWVDVALTLYYWLTLASVALCLCMLVARVVRAAAAPAARRLSAALLYLGAGLALAAGQRLLAVISGAAGLGVIVQTVMLGLLAAMALSTGQDLRKKAAPAG
jgi:hypothetical protein